MWGTVFVGVGCSRLLLVAPMIPHLECAHSVVKVPAAPAREFILSLREAEGPRGGLSERRQRRMRSTLVMRQEALATGVSATGTEVEGGESTWSYFRLFFLYWEAANSSRDVRSAGRRLAMRSWGDGRW